MTNSNAAYPSGMDKNEIKVISRLIRDALKAGCTVAIHDGEEWSIRPIDKSVDHDVIAAEIAATDETEIVFDLGGQRAIFWLVHGNAASEVIADMSDTPFANGLMTGARTVIDNLEKRGL